MSFHNMNEEDFGSDDSSDEDYVPCEANLGSEEEDSGEDETLLLGDDNQDGEVKKNSKNKGKRRKTATKKSKKQKMEEKPEDAVTEEKDEKTIEDNKKKVDNIWADFLKDVGGPKKNSNEEKGEMKLMPSMPKPEKVTIVTEYDFAGETVRVSSEVDVNSKQAKMEEKRLNTLNSSSPSSPSSSTPSSTNPVSSTTPSTSSPVLPKTLILGSAKRSASGLTGLLDKLHKKPKISVLEKSKLDWGSFKRAEGIGEELEQHNRGKNGYLEKVAFLQRADLKQYEIERDLRMSSRKST